MEAPAVARLLEPLKQDIKELGVKRLLLVGSVARGESTDSSDVDFVVEFEGRATFLGYMGLLELLEKTLGRPIDLVTHRALRDEIASSVLSEAKVVA